MTVPAWELKSKEALKAFLKKNTKALQALIARDAVEADTRTFVTDLMVEGLGFDKYDELTAEYLVKGQFADLGVRVEKKLLAFVEIKRVSTELKEQHLRQVKAYAADDGVEWVILTNGRIWECYHVSNTTPLEVHLLFQVDLLDDSTISQKVEKLWQIGREGLKRNVLTSLWKSQSALQDEVIEHALVSPPVVAAVRAEIRRKTGQLVDLEKLKVALRQLLG